jgi:phosphoesterase RecJ-like protein
MSIVAATSELRSIQEALGRAKQVVLVGHVTPDSDCLGSMCGAGMAIRDNLGHRVSLELPEGSWPVGLAFILEWAGIPRATAEDRASCDTVVVLDTAKSSRCNTSKDWGFLDNGQYTVLNIDHHAPNPGYGGLNWIVGDASSTCELVCRLIEASGWSLSATCASVLYTGILGDTAGFTLQNTTAEAFHAAGTLARAGADVGRIGELMLRSQRQSDFDLLRIIYDNTRLIADGRIAYSTADYDEINGCGCHAADIDDQVSVPRSLGGIQIAVLFTEGVRGKIRMNFRGESGVAALPLAQKIGGGGHTFAAGAILEGTMDQVVQRVIGEATRYLDAHAKA